MKAKRTLVGMIVCFMLGQSALGARTIHEDLMSLSPIHSTEFRKALALSKEQNDRLMPKLSEIEAGYTAKYRKLEERLRTIKDEVEKDHIKKKGESEADEWAIDRSEQVIGTVLTDEQDAVYSVNVVAFHLKKRWIRCLLAVQVQKRLKVTSTQITQLKAIDSERKKQITNYPVDPESTVEQIKRITAVHDQINSEADAKMFGVLTKRQQIVLNIAIEAITSKGKE